MERKINSVLIAVTAFLFAACSAGSSDWEDYTGTADTSGSSSSSSSSSSSVPTTGGDVATFTIAIDSTTAVSETDNVDATDEDYVENSTFGSTIYIAYNGTSATVTGSVSGVTATVSGADVTVTSTVAGVDYVLSGTTTDGSLKVYSDKKYELTLNGVNIKNNDGPAINSQSKKSCYVVLKSGTTNYLTDGTSYATSTEDQKGTVFSEGQLLFSGSGNLRISANCKAGISSDDYIMIRPTTNIYIKSTAGNGIKANEALIINGGIINVETTSTATAAKGLSSDGYIEINGGRTTAITAGTGEYDSDDKDVSGGAGVKSDSLLTVNGGELLCTSTGSGGKGISGDQKMVFNDGTVKVITTGSKYTYGSYDTSAKGIKADGTVEINGGSIMVRATGSGSEGIESKSTLTINSGSVEVYSNDDAINSSSHMYIKGGWIYTFATNNDGLDANGNLYIQGGTTVAYGTSSPECGIDANEEGGYHVYITGGTLVGIGGGTSYPYSSGTTQPYIVYGGTVSSGTTLALNSSSANILTFTMGRSYSGTTCFLLTSPSLTKGSSYTLYSGATATGTDWHGLITSATVSSTGSSVASVSSLSSPYSSVGSSTGGMGGGGGRW